MAKCRYAVNSVVEIGTLFQDIIPDNGYYCEEFIKNNCTHDLIVTNCNGNQTTIKAKQINHFEKEVLYEKIEPKLSNNVEKIIINHNNPYDVFSRKITISCKGYNKPSWTGMGHAPLENSKAPVYYFEIDEEELLYGDPIYIPELDYVFSFPKHGTITHPIQRLDTVFKNTKEENVKLFNIDNNIKISLYANVKDPAVEYIYVNILDSVFKLKTSHDNAADELVLFDNTDDINIKRIPLESLLKNAFDSIKVGDINSYTILLGLTQSHLNTIKEKTFKNVNVFDKLYVSKLEDQYKKQINLLVTEHKKEIDEIKRSNNIGTDKKDDLILEKDKELKLLIKDQREEIRQKEYMWRQKEQSLKDDILNIKEEHKRSNNRWITDTLGKALILVAAAVITIIKDMSFGKLLGFI